MISTSPPPPTATTQVLRSLFLAARRRARGRSIRQAQLMNRQAGSSSKSLAALGVLVMFLVTCSIHVWLGITLVQMVDQAQWMEHEKQGRLVVPEYAAMYLNPKRRSDGGKKDWMQQLAERSANFRKLELGGTRQAHVQQVLDHAKQYGRAGFITDEKAVTLSLQHPADIRASLWAPLGLVMLWWFLMMVFQGEGLDMDFQRRRHPMWEWLTSHPVLPWAAFSAEMLAAFIANPIYWSAPFFWGVLWGTVHGFGWEAMLAALIVGPLLAVAASSCHKALEIAAYLRLPSRTRGAVMGLINWAGYCLILLPLFMFSMPMLRQVLLAVAMPMASWMISWPTRILLSGWSSGPVLGQAMIVALVVGLLMLGGALLVIWWGTQRGMQSRSVPPASAPHLLRATGGGFLRHHPLYRKELLWFWRDKGAVVQAVLIPLTIGATQAFNLSSFIEITGSYWNGICGFGIICGTYFLVVLGPRSLASEGPALWMTLTWPLGLENLLQAKARLWWMLSNAIVSIAFVAALVIYPADGWKIIIVALGWVIFSHSLAEKSVALVTAPSSSVEVERPSAGRQWAALLGTLAFASGVMTQSWHTAILGVVFSSLSAAAMWQNLRARLPFLYDPWSEKRPEAPTLMHAMIGVTILVEMTSLIVAISLSFGGMERLWQARAITYGLVGLATWGGMVRFLRGRGVSQKAIWQGSRQDGHALSPWLSVSAGVVAGVVLAGLAVLYLRIASSLPSVQEALNQMNAVWNNAENRAWKFLLAVGVAPVAEEFFFRGLLFRALDREWGGRAALLGSAAFFAIYHPPVSWLPVFAVGLANAWLLKKSGHLSACVALHMTYNAVLLLLR